jgi:hypothetical protein
VSLRINFRGKMIRKLQIRQLFFEARFKGGHKYDSPQSLIRDVNFKNI